MESLLRQLCAEVTEMADELKDEVAPATLKLLDALEYRTRGPRIAKVRVASPLPS